MNTINEFEIDFKTNRKVSLTYDVCFICSKEGGIMIDWYIDTYNPHTRIDKQIIIRFDKPDYKSKLIELFNTKTITEEILLDKLLTSAINNDVCTTKEFFEIYSGLDNLKIFLRTLIYNKETKKKYKL